MAGPSAKQIPYGMDGIHMELASIPPGICLECGGTVKTSEFVSKAKSIENYEKTKAYFKAMKCNVRNNNPAAANKPTPKNVYARHIRKNTLSQERPRKYPKGCPN